MEDAANAADLAIKRLKKDLERGKIDQDLLDELGWTESQLKEFSQRMHDQLNSLKDTDAKDEANRLQRRRLEERLKSLDLDSGPSKRTGNSNRDRHQQDTTSRQSTPPAAYRDLIKMRQKSLSRGKRPTK